MAQGVFITFEGSEKSGKSTHARLLGKYLAARGLAVVFVREPGSTGLGEKIRRVLLDRNAKAMSVMTEMLLYMAARAQLAQEVIAPALKKGRIVLCDRFLDSTIAYQGYGCGLDTGLIKRLGVVAVGGLRPDLTLLLEFRESARRRRQTASPDRIEMRPDAFHRRVQRGYRRLARQEPDRIKVVSVLGDRQVTQEKIRTLVEQCLLEKSSAMRPSSRR